MPPKTKKSALFVSYYANRRLNNETAKPISISRGNPRFRISYKIENRIPELVPGQEARDTETEQDFADAYVVQLEKLGVEKVQGILNKLKDETGRPLVLLCFEDLIREGKMFCHRQVFAGWWEHHTGARVPEFDSGLLVTSKPVEVTRRRRISPVSPESVKNPDRSRSLPDVKLTLSEFAIYVNASNKHLEDASNGADPSNPITENRRWVRGRELWMQAKERGEELPLIFATFKDLTYWAITRDITVDDEKRTTIYRFSDLRPLHGYERKNLEVESTRKKLPNTYIRSYVPVRTPSFLTA